MRLFYTGAVKNLAIQSSPIVSLGGFISRTLVSSGVTNSIVPNISQKDLQGNGSYTILLALQNLTSNPAAGIKVYYELTDTSLYDITLGLVQPAIDSTGVSKFESITSPQSLPVGITFTNALGLVNAVDGGTLQPQDYLGIWIKREIKNTAKDTFNSCDALYDSILNPQNNKIDFPFDLKIEYT